jgi:hypothetical protein
MSFRIFLLYVCALVILPSAAFVFGEDPPTQSEIGTAAGTVVCSASDNVPARATLPATISVLEGNTVTVQARDAVDPDNSPPPNPFASPEITFYWEVIGGRGLLEEGPFDVPTDSDQISFLAPVNLERATLGLRLTVLDPLECGHVYGFNVVIETPFSKNVDPIPALSYELPEQDPQEAPDTGELVAVPTPIEIILDGSSSSDPDTGDVLSFEWVLNDGELTNGSATLTAAEGLARRTLAIDGGTGTVTVTLIVEDDRGGQSSTSISFVVSAIYELFYSQIGFGPVGSEELRTGMILINDEGQDAESIHIRFYDQKGEPLNVKLGPEDWNPDEPVSLTRGSARQLNFAPDGTTPITVGWATVESDVQLEGIVLYQLVETATGALNSETSLFSSPKGSRFTTYFGREDGLAMAVANPGSESVEVIARLLDPEQGWGMPVSINTFDLEPGEHTATFLDPKFWGDLPEDFSEGTVVLETRAGDLIGTVLKTRSGVPFSTLPLSNKRGTVAFNSAPGVKLQYRLGDSGLFLDAPESGNVAVAGAVSISLDAGNTTDDKGIQNLEFTFSSQQDLSSGGAVLTPAGATAVLDVSEGTNGTVTVTVVVTDDDSESTNKSVVFEITPE